MNSLNSMTRRGFLASVAGLGVASSLALAGCGSSDSSDFSAGSTAESEGGKTTISFWYSMEGSNETAIQKVIDGFNEQSDSYTVEGTYQGKYDESTGKYFNMAGGDGAPALIQIGEQNLQSMIDSGLIADVSQLIKDHDFDDSDLLEQAVNFYTVNDVLYTMPFNCSSPVVYYNKDVVTAAGVTEFPQSFEEIADLVDTIAQAGEISTPLGMYAYGYALDQMVTNMGGYVLNNKNGREKRATKVAYEEQITDIFDWVAEIQGKGQLVNYGTDSSNTVTGFSQKECAIFISTSAIARSVIDTCENFEVGISPLPVKKGSEAEGVYAGGGALCISANLADDVAKGVMEFCAYATSADVQAVWAGDTGYYPICNAAYETDAMKEVYETYPQLEVSADQLLGSKVNDITAGPLCSQLPQLRTDLQTALESVFNGGDVDSAIQIAVDSTNAAIESANAGVAE